MPKKSAHASEVAISIQAPGALKTLSLTSNQLEQWCANIEKENNPNEKTDAYLSVQFLSRYGLKNCSEVIAFLKTDAGKTTIALIRDELIRIEELNNYRTQQAREEALRRESILVFILMGAIAQREEQAKQIADITQQQIDQKLKGSKQSESTTRQQTPIDILDANIKSFNEAIMVLDMKQMELESNLKTIDDELKIIEKEEMQITHHHADFNAHMDQLNAYLQLSKLLQSGTNYTAHANQQIETLTTQLATLRVQNAAQTITSGATATPNVDRNSNANRKISVLEEQLAFHQNLIKQPAVNWEQAFEQLVEQVHSQISQQEYLYENQTMLPYHRSEMECLGLQALQVLRRERVLLDAQLETVHDLNQAYFIIDPNHQSRYRKQGDSYVIFSEDVDPTKNLTEKDWLHAKLNFDRLKSDVCVIHVHHNEQMQQQTTVQQQRRQYHLKTREAFVSQRDELKSSKAEMLKSLSSAKTQRELLFKKTIKPTVQEKTEYSSTKQETLVPKPRPKLIPKKSEHQSSYSLMMKKLECLVPKQKPAPRKEDIQKVSSVLKAIVPPDRQKALKELIDEVTPNEIMTSDTRLEWLQRAKRLIPRPNDNSDRDRDLDWKSKT